MTREKLSRALPALAELAKLQLPYDKARHVQRWYKAAEANQQELREQWQALRDKYHADENGQTLTFRTAEDKTAFEQEWTACAAEQAERAVYNPVDLSAQRDTIRVSAAILEALDGIVIWEGSA